MRTELCAHFQPTSRSARSEHAALAGKIAVNEAVSGSIAALALRTFSDDVRDTILRELRSSITTRIMSPDALEAATLTLQLEEHSPAA